MRRRKKPVVDATAPMVVKVTQRDIDRAIQGDPENCAVALGCKRKPGVADIRVGATTAFVDYADRVERYVIDRDTRERLAVFDRDGYFAVGTYILNPPPVGRRIGDRAGTKPGSNTRQGRARGVDRANPLRGRVSAGQFTT